MNRRLLLEKLRTRWMVLAILLVFVEVAKRTPGLGEWYSRTIYPLFAAPLSRFSGGLPFSLGDCFIYGSVAGILAYLVYVMIKRRRIWQAFRRILEYLAWVYVWFYMAWGLNYFRDNFFTRTQIPYVAYSSSSFQSFLGAYVDSLNAAWVPVPRVDSVLVAEIVRKGYTEMPERFGINAPDPSLHPKTMLFSRLMSGVGVMGYMGPFFTEFHLNGQLLPVQYPSTYAHEMAHMLGISNEAEANLYSFLICTGATVPEIRFSGYLSLLPYVLSNAYGVLEEEAYERLIARIRPEVKEVYNQKTAYWQALYSPTIGEMQNLVYDLFLKGNKIATGTANYSEVIALLIALENDNAHT